MSTNRARRTALFAVLGLALAACSTGYQAAVPLVRVHAANDLDCPDHDIRIEEQLGGQFQAAGCGRKARYRAACEGVSCVVSGENDPAVPWHDRPEPGDPTWH